VLGKEGAMPYLLKAWLSYPRFIGWKAKASMPLGLLAQLLRYQGKHSPP